MYNLGCATTTMNSPPKRPRETSPSICDTSFPGMEPPSTSPPLQGPPQLNNAMENVSTNGSARIESCRSSHNMVERRRAQKMREKIGTLASIVARAGKTTKRDKNSILAATVDYVRELEEKVSRAGEQHDELSRRNCSGPNSRRERYYERLFNSCTVPQAVISLEGKFLDCNDSFCSLVGYSKEAMLQLSVFSMTPENEQARSQGIISDMLSHCEKGVGGQPIQRSFRKEIIARGKQLELSVSTSLVCDDRGRPEYFVSSVMEAIPVSTCREKEERYAEASGMSSLDDTGMVTDRTCRGIPTVAYRDHVTEIPMDQDSLSLEGENSFPEWEVVHTAAPASPSVSKFPYASTETC
eukprot:gb/GECG01009300.1/.p1 GENE.gb/GECG01009300.1/~~gb/GECG01009300.1/.p1  ORF type:complete len:354 (+),score=35.11 gb/GECG01009300.1/:1-1062(+)